MNIKDLKIGDKVCNKQDGFPMIVVGLYSTLKDLSNGTVNLDSEAIYSIGLEHSLIGSTPITCLLNLLERRKE